MKRNMLVKWLLSGLLTASMIAGLAACGSEEPETLESKDTVQAEENNSSEKTNIYYTSDYSSRDAVLADGLALSEEIASEGIVLLKNQDDALPVPEGANVTVLGKNSANPVYTGTGSGAGTTYYRSTLYESLQEKGFNVNPVMMDFYQNDELSGVAEYHSSSYMDKNYGIPTNETPVDSYRQEELDSFAEYNDLAIIVISRLSGEGADMPVSSWDTLARTDSGQIKAYEDPDAEGGYRPEPVAGRTDGSEHYLELDDNEKALIELAKESGFEKICVVINSVSQMELGFIKDDPEIDSALWVGAPGQRGFLAMADILKGEVNPSGHLVDTYAADFTKSPTYNNFATGPAITEEQIIANFGGDKVVEDEESGTYFMTDGWGNSFILSEAGAIVVDDADSDGGGMFARYNFSGSEYEEGDYSYERYVKYKEGIYSGYRYYETVARDLSDGEVWYDANVVYPFGYGLSYTTFDWSVESGDILLEKDGINVVHVNVTNTGEVAGKDVVQLYAEVPQIEGGVNKSATVLAAFSKTELLQPGESQTVELSFSTYSIASWDMEKAHGDKIGAYILDSGEYVFKLQTDSHHEKDGVDEALTCVLDEEIVIDEDPVTGTELENLFEEGMNILNGEEFIPLSRADLSSEVATANALRADTAEERLIDIDTLADLYESTYLTLSHGKDLDEWDADKEYYVPEEQRPVSGVDSGIKAIQLIGLDMEDELYDAFVQQFTDEQLDGYLQSTAAVEAFGLPGISFTDGPTGYNNKTDSMSYPNGCILAASWNTELSNKSGILIGEEGLWENVVGWYGTATNIHRSEFAGRNMEYYSEDPLLAGKIAAAQIQGVTDKGIVVTLKHIFLNNQETNRGGDCGGVITYCDEQTMREIYLKPFEYAIKEGGSNGVMTSFNRIGNVVSGAYSKLNRDLLYDEWGFRGYNCSDAAIGNYFTYDVALRGGTDKYMGSNVISRNDFGEDSADPLNGQYTATTLSLMQEAAKHIIYSVVNSAAMNGVAEDGTLPEVRPLSYVDEAGNPQITTNIVTGDEEESQGVGAVTGIYLPVEDE